MNYQDYQLAKTSINSQISMMRSELSRSRASFIESMQAQGWAYIHTEYLAYGETYGLSARLLSPEFLAKHSLAREQVEGDYEYVGKDRTAYRRDRIDDIDIDWDEIDDEDEKEVIYL